MNIAKLRAISPKIQFALAGLAIVALAGGGWFILVSPKRADSVRYAVQIADVQKEISDRRAGSTARQARVAVKTADLFKLAKVMPAEEDMAAIILQLNQVATDSGIVFESITPALPAGGDGFRAVPIALRFSGNFYTLSDFLFRLRQLVQVRDGQLSATGQLFSVDTLSFMEDEERKFPFIEADLTVDAFVFGGLPAPPGTPGVPPTTTEPTTSPSTDTTTTSTGETPTTPTPTPDPSGSNATPIPGASS